MKETHLSPSFFRHDTLHIARALLGKMVIHTSPEGTTTGRIVETEAYLSHDPASHSFNGMTPRNKAMFGPAGTAYVYFIYGMYYCFNVVTNKPGIGEAVLIRALEPVNGIELMKKQRGPLNKEKLCNGPGKLTQAMNITNAHNGHDLLQKPLYITEGTHDGIIGQSTRIGIAKGNEHLYRFFIQDSPYISKK